MPYSYYITPVIDNGVLKWPKAGCVPIAAAQVISSTMFHKNKWGFPNITATDGTVYEIDWLNILRSVTDTVKYSTAQVTIGSKAIAKLVRAIGACTNIEYGLELSAADTNLIPALYTQLGFQNSSVIDFSKDVVYDMIVNNQTPVYSRAINYYAENGTNGHAFVLDGLLRLQYTTDIYLANPITGQITGEVFPHQSTFDLIHCNFGGGGTSDGYYTPGAFDLLSTEFWEYNEPDDIPYADLKNYNTMVKIIPFELQ